MSQRTASRTSFQARGAPMLAHAEFEVAERIACRIASRSAVSRAYNRTSMLERRRPLMQAWTDFVTGKTGGNVVSFRAAAGE